MEYAAGSSRKDPGQGHINLLPSDNMITEAPMRQFEPCHCCKMYDRPCLRSSSSKKKSDHNEVSKEYANPRPEINGKKEKAPTGPSGVQPPRYRLMPNAAPKAPPRNTPSGKWIFRPPQQQGATRFSTPQQQQHSGPRTNDRPFSRRNSYNRCFNCGSTFHFAKNCPEPKKSYSSQNFNQNTNQNNQGKGKKQDIQGKINLITLAKLLEQQNSPDFLNPGT